MINLTPIAEKIQKRLFEKMKVLGRNSKSTPNSPQQNDLTHEKMSTRSTFLRMTSGQLNPVVLMGGKLKNTGFTLGNIVGGYDELYGPRTYGVQDDDYTQKQMQNYQLGTGPSEFDDLDDAGMFRAGQVGLTDYKTVNNNSKRPIPGVKSLDVTFKGGVRALREATISWTCWDWKELNILMPHFLAHGKTVMIEWGWVYDENTLQKLPNFLEHDELQNQFISADAYDNYRNLITEADGDFDMMVGIIKNFEFTTREDGGFDCQTLLTSVGASILENPEPNEAVIDPNISYNLSVNDDTRELVKKIKEATGEDATDLDNKNSLIDIDTSVSLKLFIKNIDNYIINKLKETSTDKKVTYDDSSDVEPSDGMLTSGFTPYILYDENKFMCDVGTFTDLTNQSKETWVRWGWFEDNVLSKFLSVTSDRIITKFRSIERIQKAGKDSDKYESTRIKNHPRLETVDIGYYILPGQFFPVKQTQIKIAGKNIPFGDTERIRTLADLANTKFSRFSTQKNAIGKEGYLRNMLINTSVIKKAFGVDGDTNFTVESINVVEAIQTIFDLLNQHLNFWSYNLVVDEVETNRAKIIDESTTNFDFKKPSTAQKSFMFGEKVVTDDTDDAGVFFFPVWQNNSIVKSQNITAKVPNAMQLSIMYGANMDQFKEFTNPGSQFTDKGSVAAGGLWNTSFDADKKNLDIAIRNQKTKKIGVKHGLVEFVGPKKSGSDLVFIDDANTELNFTDGDDIKDFLTGKTSDLEENYNDKLEKLETNLRVAGDAGNVEKEFDEAIPPPMFGSDGAGITQTQLLAILEKEVKDNRGKLRALFANKFVDNKMKPEFQDTVSYLTTLHGITKQVNTPLIIPIDIELEIDGIGGIYPGNSFHSVYLPKEYQERTVFQAFDINHKLDATTWSVTISGKMRSTLGSIFEGYKTLNDLTAEQLENWNTKAEQDAQQRLDSVKDDRKKAAPIAESFLYDKSLASQLGENNRKNELSFADKLVRWWTDKK